MRCSVQDRSEITRRKRTAEGYLLVPGQIAASDNVQPYLAGELGIKGMDPKKVVRIYRPKAAVDAAASTFDGKPVTLGHPTSMVSAKTWRTVARGEARNVRTTDSGLDADLLVRDERAIEAIESGRAKELSCAYDFELTLQAGMSPKGEAYDGTASELVGNHVAIVQVARGGRSCRVADSENQGDQPMRIIAFDAKKLGAATGIRLELEEPTATQVEDSINCALGARDHAVQALDTATKECAEKLEAQAKDHAEKVKVLEDSIPARVAAAAADRAGVLAGAEKIGIKLQAEGKDTLTLRREVLAEASKDAGRKAVVDAMVPDLAKLDETTAVLATKALFAMPTVQAAKSKDGTGHNVIGRELAGNKPGGVTATAIGRDAAIEASSNAWKTK